MWLFICFVSSRTKENKVWTNLLSIVWPIVSCGKIRTGQVPGLAVGTTKIYMRMGSEACV